MISTADFLAHVLPREGYYCAVVFKDGFAPQHFFHHRLGAVVDHLLVNDANGYTVYHACATFLSAGPRRADNARCMRSLWLDVDAGEGKPYQDADQARS